MYPDSLKNLIETLKYLPGVGEKTAERYAFALLNQDEEKIELLSDAIKESKQKIKRNLLIIFTDRQIQHRVEYQHQRNITTEAGKHKQKMHMTDHIFPDTERNSKQAAEYNIQNQPQIVARQDIVIPLLIDHIRHIARQYRIERSSCQQGKDKNIQYRSREKASSRIT